MIQKLCNTLGEIYAEREVLAGPHEWEVGTYKFITVIVRAPDDSGGKRGLLSMIDVRSGYRVARVEVSAPKTKPHAALYACSRAIDELRGRVGDPRFIATLQRPVSLTEAREAR